MGLLLLIVGAAGAVFIAVDLIVLAWAALMAVTRAHDAVCDRSE